MKILLDANIVIALMFQKDELHEEATVAAKLAGSRFEIMLSTATFMIACYYINKQIKSQENKAAAFNNLFLFQFTSEDDAVIRQVQQSRFHDKEDALQYFSALKSGVDAILTFNVHDYYPYSEEIEIYHPVEFIQKFAK